MRTNLGCRARASFALAIASLALAGTASAQSPLFVKVEDLSAPGARTYEGADIEAIELLSPSGTARFTLDGVSNQAFDDEMYDNIAEALA